MSHIPKAGDIYIVTAPFQTFGTQYLEQSQISEIFIADSEEGYVAGDKLILHEPTGLDPFGFQSQISNWIIECKYFKPPQDESVWSGIWLMIERKLIVWENDYIIDSMVKALEAGGESDRRT
jgi:hypothetical protein